MIVRKLALFFVCFCGLAIGQVDAQSEARIRVAVPSIDHIEDDLKWMIELSPEPGLKKQWLRLKGDILDAFTQGVDPSQPAAVDIVFHKDDVAYELRVPILNLLDKNKGFLPGIEGMGFKVKPVGANAAKAAPKAAVANGAYYEFAEKGQKPSYLRYDKKYAWISKTSIPANLPAPMADYAQLLALNKDVVAELKNDASGLDARRKNFEEFRKQIEAVIKLRRNEDPNAFELRKLALVQQLDEAERFLVESEQLLLNWTTTTDGPTPAGRGEILLTALKGTDLEKSIEEFAAKPSHFANVQLHQKPLAVGRMTFPLDDLRIKHVKEFYKIIRPTMEVEIDKRAGKTDAQKVALKSAMNTFLDMLDAGTSLRVIDAFADAYEAEAGKNVLITAIRAADGKVTDQILKLLPQFNPEWQVKLNAEDHAGVSIHEVLISKARLPSFQKVFPGETLLYVGTSKDVVWGAAGVDALKHLKTAIDQAALPAPEKVDPVVIAYQVQLAKIVTLMEMVQKESPAGAAKTEKQEKQDKEIERFRKLAKDAMAGCESLMHGELRRVDNKIEGFLEFNECALKLIGTAIADGVKKVLE